MTAAIFHRPHKTSSLFRSTAQYHTTPGAAMPSINVSLKDGASADQLAAAKKQVTDQGGKITNEFKLIKGFTAEFPADKVHSLQSNEHLNVEADGQVKTQ